MPSLAKVLAIARLHLSRTLRNKFTLGTMTLMPMLLSYIFGTAYGGPQGPPRLSLLVVDEDGSAASGQLAEILETQLNVEVRRQARAEAEAAVAGRRAAAALVIEAGFGGALQGGGPVRVEMLTQPNLSQAATLVQVVQGAAARLTTGQPPRITVQTESVRLRPQPVTGRNFASLGYLVLFAMWSSVASSGSILEERQAGTWGRLLTTPTARWQILAGKLLGAACVGAMQVLILVLFGTLALDADWFVTAPLAAALLLTAFILCSVCLGLLLSTFVRSNAQLQATLPLILISTSMLGGAMWPAELMPSYMQLIGLFTPQGWAMQGLIDATLRGAGLAGVLAPSLILLSLALVLLVVAIPRLRFE